MYPLPAVLVNCGGPPGVPVRTALVEYGVTIEAEFPRVEDVFKRWPARPLGPPRLVVFRLQGAVHLAAAARLSGTFPGWPLMALVEGDCDASALYAVSRAGAAQLLPCPFAADDMTLALDRLPVQFSLHTSPSHVLAVVGAVAGVGVTTVGVALAAELVACGKTVVLTEVGSGVGRLADYLDVTPEVTTHDLLAAALPTVATVQAALVAAAAGLRVLAGPYKAIPAAPAAAGVEPLFQRLRRLADVVVAVLAGPHDPLTMEAAAVADRVLLVGRQDVPAVHAMQLVRQAVLARGLRPPLLLLNGFDPGRQDFGPAAVEKAVGAGPVRTVAVDLAAVRSAVDSARPLTAAAPDGPAANDLRRLARDVLHELGLAAPPPPPPRTPLTPPARGLLGRLFGGG